MMDEYDDRTYRENPKCLVRAVANEGDQPDGLEMRFTDQPPEDVRNELKNAGWVFAPAPENRYWFKREATDADYALAHKLGGEFETTEPMAAPSNERPSFEGVSPDEIIEAAQEVANEYGDADLHDLFRMRGIDKEEEYRQLYQSMIAEGATVSDAMYVTRAAYEEKKKRSSRHSQRIQNLNGEWVKFTGEHDDVRNKPIGFGKHAELTPVEVWKKDPNYAIWMIRNLDSDHIHLVETLRTLRDEMLSSVQPGSRITFGEDETKGVVQEVLERDGELRFRVEGRFNPVYGQSVRSVVRENPGSATNSSPLLAGIALTAATITRIMLGK